MCAREGSADTESAALLAGRLVRWLAWAALLSVAVALVRAEVLRPELPPGVVAYTDIVYRRVGSRQERLDVYLPRALAQGGRPVVLAIHGGGWCGGNKSGYGREVAALAEHGYVVVAPSYLRARTGAPSWPENLDDLRHAVGWVKAHAGDYGIDPNRIAAMGASAGGHLAALLGTGLIQGDRGDEARVRAVISFYGPADLEANYRFSASAAEPIARMLGGTPAAVPARYTAASPLLHVTHAACPMLLVHGARDPLVPVAQSQALANALAGAGVRHDLIVVQRARHGFRLRGPEGDFTRRILDFLQTVWNDDEIREPLTPNLRPVALVPWVRPTARFTPLSQAPSQVGAGLAAAAN